MTTATLRPNGTLNGAPTLVGGATIQAVTSDNSDASYATNTTASTAQVIGIDLTTVALPAGAVTKTITSRVRGSGDGTAFIAMGPTKTPGGTLLVSDTFSMSTTITTYTGTPTAVTLTQSEIDALSITSSLGCSPTSTYVRAFEYYIDLVYATVPTCAVTAPSGTVTTTTAPTVTWTYTAGSDGDVQSRYQVRIFSAAQYGIGGFDPATSPNTYDSGIVSSAALSAVSGALTNGTTFKAYVNVAQTINGTPQWSGWTAGSTFTISVTPANISTVVGTADNTNGRISVVVTRVTAGSPPTWTSAEVQRSDDGGTTWAYVRSANGAAVSGTTYTVIDYEALNGIAATYRARATYLSSGLPITGAWVTSSLVTWTADVDWLKMPSHPSLNRTVTVEANPQLLRPRRQGVLQVLGRADPVVVSDVLSYTSGALIIVTHTDQEAVDLLALLAYDVLLFQARPGARFGQKYIAVAGITEMPFVGLAKVADRRWQIPFNEVVSPIDTGVS